MGGPTVPNQAKLDGLNPLAYMGVRPSSPPQMLVETRDPGVNDNKYVLATFWLNNNSPYNLWILVNLAKGIATWEMITTGGGVLNTLTSNAGGAVGPTAGNINVVGDGVTITGTGNPGTSTITFAVVGGAVLSSLTGNSGGAVPPNMGNINIVGAGGVAVAGNPGTNTLTITAGGGIAESFPTDAGTATPAGNVLNVLGGTAARDINTSGSGNTIHIDLNNAITLGDLSNLGAASALTATTGSITVTAGDIFMPLSNVGATQGVYKINNTNFLYSASNVSNAFVGANAGNLSISSGGGNSIFGNGCGSSLSTGSSNVMMGTLTGTSMTSGGNNILIGSQVGILLVSGNSNIALGTQAFGAITSGSNNIGIGPLAGSANLTGTEANNIYIQNHGVNNESNTMRLGTTGGGNFQVSKTFVAGTFGVNVGSVASVVSVVAGGQIGSTTIQGGSGITVTPGANTITISGSGIIVFTYTNVNTTPYVVQSTDEYLSVDTSALAITVQLPNAAPSTGRVYYIKDRTGAAGTRNITVTTVGGAVTIDGSTSFVMNTNFESINVIYNGSNYEVF